MLTVAIASGDQISSSQLLAALAQTGLVGSVKQWILPMEKLPDVGETMPDIVLLDLARDPEPYFTLGAHLRRLKPDIRLIACSALVPPNQQLLLDAMRSGVQDFIPKPVKPEALEELLNRLSQEIQPGDRRSVEKLVVLMGSKGGVGTTTVAVNLGVQLATHAQKRTVLLDLARPLGNVHLLLDLHPRFGVRDAVESLDRLDTHFFGGLLTQHKTKLEILGGHLLPEEWQSVPILPMERIVNVAQASFDMVLADLGSQFSSEWGSVLNRARMILMVAEANVPSLWTLERRLVALTGLGVESDRIRIVINRWHKGDDEVLKTIEKNLKHPIFACLPNDFGKANTAVNLGTPLMENHNNYLSNRYRALAAQLAGMESVQPTQKRSGLTNFFATNNFFTTKR
jgi:pilus assembly protein CpaE